MIVGNYRSRSELRKDRRRQMIFRVAILSCDGKFLCECDLADISESGVRLTVAPSVDLPDEFILMLSKNGVRRHCRVVWRAERKIGIEFLNVMRPDFTTGSELVSV
jgi:hypothetical protein